MLHAARQLPSWLTFNVGQKTRAMMLPREKLQVGFGVLGLFLVGFGIAIVQPGARSEQPEMPRRSQGVGFWKDHTFDVATGRKVGPWMIGGGIAAVVLAYVVRQR